LTTLTRSYPDIVSAFRRERRAEIEVPQSLASPILSFSRHLVFPSAPRAVRPLIDFSSPFTPGRNQAFRCLSSLSLSLARERRPSVLRPVALVHRSQVRRGASHRRRNHTSSLAPGWTSCHLRPTGITPYILVAVVTRVRPRVHSPCFSPTTARNGRLPGLVFRPSERCGMFSLGHGLSW
jgi:hypothetical protein